MKLLFMNPGYCESFTFTDFTIYLYKAMKEKRKLDYFCFY